MKQHLQEARTADIVSRGGNNHVALPALSVNTERKYIRQWHQPERRLVYFAQTRGPEPRAKSKTPSRPMPCTPLSRTSTLLCKTPLDHAGTLHGRQAQSVFS